MAVLRVIAMSSKKVNQRLQFIVNEFINSRQVMKLSPATIEIYEEKLSRFYNYLERIKFSGSFEEITTDTLNDFLQEIGVNCVAGTVHIHYRALRTLFRWYDKEYEPKWRNPILKVSPPKIVVSPLPGIRKHEYQALLKACANSFYGKRNKAIIRILFDTGMRRSELQALNIGDVIVEAGTIIATKTKNKKRRSVFMTPETKRDVLRYIRDLQNQKPFSPLWVDRNGNRLSINGLREILRRLSLKAGIQEPGFHDFRRAFALQSRRNGMGEIDLMRIMGHSSTDVLNRYLDMDDEDLKAVYDKTRSEW